MAPGNELVRYYGVNCAVDMIREIQRYSLLYHIGEKLPYDRLEREAKTAWNRVTEVMKKKYPDIPDVLYWNQWRKIRGDYFTESCPTVWKEQLPFLGYREMSPRYSTRSNIAHWVMSAWRMDECLDEIAEERKKRIKDKVVDEVEVESEEEEVEPPVVKKSRPTQVRRPKKTTPQPKLRIDHKFRSELKQRWSKYDNLEFPDCGFWSLKRKILQRVGEIHAEAD